jgi:hypothetical protein
MFIFPVHQHLLLKTRPLVKSFDGFIKFTFYGNSWTFRCGGHLLCKMFDQLLLASFSNIFFHKRSICQICSSNKCLFPEEANHVQIFRFIRTILRFSTGATQTAHIIIFSTKQIGHRYPTTSKIEKFLF